MGRDKTRKNPGLAFNEAAVAEFPIIHHTQFMGPSNSSFFEKVTGKKGAHGLKREVKRMPSLSGRLWISPKGIQQCAVFDVLSTGDGEVMMAVFQK